MKICFAGLENSLLIDSAAVTTLEIHNRVLFARICQSLLCDDGLEAPEPFSLWEGDAKLKPKSELLLVSDPLHLPWDDKFLGGSLAECLEDRLYEDDDGRIEIEGMVASIESRLLSLTLRMQSEYTFAVNWDVKRFLKCFGFGVEQDRDESLFDKLIKFLLLAEDVGLKKCLVFVNLKSFFSQNELENVLKQSFYSGLRVLLLENAPDDRHFEMERKYTIDEDFLEY